MSQEALFASMIFIVVLLMTQAFVTPLMGSRRKAQRQLRNRIRDLANTSRGGEHLSLVREKYLQRLSPFQRRLESLPLMEALRARMAQAGWDQPAHRLVSLSAGLVLGAGSIALWSSGAVATALVASVLAGALPFLALQRRRGRRMQKFEAQLPDALSVAARALKAGLPFSEAIKMVSTEMEEPVSGEFGRVFAELNYGGEVRNALFGLLERMPTIAVMAVVTAVLIQRETGGNLAEVMDRIGNLIRQRFRFQRSVRTLSAEGRGTAWIVAVMPFALAVLTEGLRPGWVTDLVADPTGKSLIIGAFVLMVIGILWLRRLVNIDV